MRRDAHVKIPRLSLRVKNRTTRAFSIQVVGEGPVRDAEGQYELVEIVLSEAGAAEAAGTYRGPEPGSPEPSAATGWGSVWYREACIVPDGEQTADGSGGQTERG